MQKYDMIYLDDEVSLTKLFEIFVKGLFPGRNILTFNHPKNFLELVQKKEIDSKVWLIDIMLPGKENGFEIAKLIRATYPDANIYFYTALPQSSIDPIKGEFEEKRIRQKGDDPADLLYSMFKHI